jgi:hypothetical protein
MSREGEAVGWAGADESLPEPWFITNNSSLLKMCNLIHFAVTENMYF